MGAFQVGAAGGVLVHDDAAAGRRVRQRGAHAHAALRHATPAHAAHARRVAHRDAMPVRVPHTLVSAASRTHYVHTCKHKLTQARKSQNLTRRWRHPAATPGTADPLHAVWPSVRAAAARWRQGRFGIPHFSRALSIKPLCGFESFNFPSLLLYLSFDKQSTRHEGI